MQLVNKAIALDLDGVIADIATPLLDIILARGVPIEDIDLEKWIISDTEDEDILKIFNEPLFWKNMKPYQDAWHQVNYWFALGYDIHIVTARRQPNAVAQTEPWLNNWNINTRAPQFAKMGEKISYIKTIDPLFVIEDNPREIRILQEAGVKCYLRAQSYNQKYWNEFDTIESLYDIDLEK
jgi:5'(3')-deoxyribonucleotidase